MAADAQRTRGAPDVPAWSAIAVLASAAALGAVGQPSFAEILRRAHGAVVIYEDHELSTVIAREHYHQRLFDPPTQQRSERTLLSDYLLIQLPPDEDWFALRDVYAVDGVTVADRAARLTNLLAAPRAQVGERALAIADESARFNLGRVPRTINVPTFALRFLRPANRRRFRFDNQGETVIEGAPAWIVGYRETRTPTFSATVDGRDVPARGRFWIEPHSGAVIRSEMILGGTRALPTRATVTVTYRFEPSVGFRVPVEMRERYDNPRRHDDEVIDAVATYTGFRPFDVRTLVPPGP